MGKSGAGGFCGASRTWSLQTKGEGRQKEQGRFTVWDEAAEIVHSFEFSALREMNELV